MDEIIRKLKPIVMMLVVCALIIGGIIWFTNDEVTEGLVSEEVLPAPLTAEQLEAYSADIENSMNRIAVLNTNLGAIEIELYEHQMPITAGNFAKLIGEGFYDGIKFHRVIDGFMVQSGDPITKTDEIFKYGTGDAGYSIPDEHISGNLLTNIRGTISMANSGPNSGSSQFFINLIDNTNLDFNKEPLSSKHPVFGRVISGMEVVDRIAKLETNSSGLPVETVTIETAVIRSQE